MALPRPGLRHVEKGAQEAHIQAVLKFIEVLRETLPQTRSLTQRESVLFEASLPPFAEEHREVRAKYKGMRRHELGCSSPQAEPALASVV